MVIHKLHWKLRIDNPATVKPADFFKVFNSWIPDSPEVFVDVADYQHVHDGPLILLVGHYVDCALDATDRQLGFLYSRKQPLAKSTAETMHLTLLACLQAALRLQADPVFNGTLSLRTDSVQLIVNDRALAPNTPETLARLRPHLEAVGTALFGNATLTRADADAPKKRFSVVMAGNVSVPLAELAARLAK